MNHTFNLKKIGFIFTDLGFLKKAQPKVAEAEIDHFLTHFKELALLAKIKPFFISQSTNGGSQREIWKAIARHIFSKSSTVDGWLVFVDSKAMIYPAVATSFMLPGLNKPVVFSGLTTSPDTQELIDSLDAVMEDSGGLGLRANIVYSLQLANIGPNEVMTCLGSHAVRATKAIKYQEAESEFLRSIDEKGMIAVDLGIENSQDGTALVSQKRALEDDLESEVEWFTLAPNISVDFFERQITKRTRGVVIDMTHIGYLPNEWIQLMERHPKVVFVTYMLHAQWKKNLHLPNVLPGPLVTPEVMYIKLAWLLRRVKGAAALHKMLSTDVRGELS